MDIFQIIKDRASYRGPYRDTPVPREHLTAILEAGCAAPSGCNKQTTSFIAIDDPALLNELKTIPDPPIGATAPAWILVLTREIVAYRDRVFNVQDYSAAIENMLLAIKALGYDSCWYEGHITDADDIGGQLARRLGVPEDYHVVGLLPVGVAAEEVRRVRKRPLEKRAWFNGFGGETE
ncbi:MAG: nitroreductase family protein [Clostridia bacterium]|nr:nitroreductase family protein [Clostridia bacterium]